VNDSEQQRIENPPKLVLGPPVLGCLYLKLPLPIPFILGSCPVFVGMTSNDDDGDLLAPASLHFFDCKILHNVA